MGKSIPQAPFSGMTIKANQQAKSYNQEATKMRRGSKIDMKLPRDHLA